MTSTALETIALGPGECRAPEDRQDPRAQIKLSSEDTGDALAICELTVPPGFGPPVHFHRFDDEWFYVLEGEFRFLMGGQMFMASTGASIFGPRRIAHTFQNIGTTPGRLLTVSNPGGLDRFFLDFAASNPPGEPIDPAVYLRLYEKHNLVYVAPPLSL
jgi:mannose-6-phosphate isomerase-like protein (cupin superfamily)